MLSLTAKPLLIVLKGAIITAAVWMFQAVATPSDVPVHDPWFWIFVLWWFFSCIASGMPEPTSQNSDTYLWAYRSMHLMAASGTSYFRNKLDLPTVRQSVEQSSRETKGD